MTDSETFRIREKTPGEKLAGEVPTCVAISPTWSFTESNKPDRLFMIPEMSISLSQS